MTNLLPHPDPAAAALSRGRTLTRVLPNGFTVLVEPFRPDGNRPARPARRKRKAAPQSAN